LLYLPHEGSLAEAGLQPKQTQKILAQSKVIF